MRVLFFGTYDAEAMTRVRVLQEGFADLGDQVEECNVPLALDTAWRVRILQRPWLVPVLAYRLCSAWARLLARARSLGEADAVVVGYLGHFDVHLARLLWRRQPVALDHLVSATFDLVCAFEVLEHIADDAAALRAWWGRLRPGGRLMLTVPPFQGRFGAADRRVGHIRRYEPGDLVATLRTAGFVDVEAVLFGFPFGRGLEAARNLLARAAPAEGSAEERSAGSGRWLQPPDRLGALTYAAALPARLSQRPFIGSRWGSGLFALARRPPQAEARSAVS